MRSGDGMKVSRQFLVDFAYVANIYEWDDKTVEEVKQETRENPGLVKYWRDLAAAHRDGYKQDRSNNWIRLEAWKQMRDEG